MFLDIAGPVNVLGTEIDYLTHGTLMIIGFIGVIVCLSLFYNLFKKYRRNQVNKMKVVVCSSYLLFFIIMCITNVLIIKANPRGSAFIVDSKLKRAKEITIIKDETNCYSQNSWDRRGSGGIVKVYSKGDKVIKIAIDPIDVHVRDYVDGTECYINYNDVVDKKDNKQIIETLLLISCILCGIMFVVSIILTIIYINRKIKEKNIDQ